MNTPTDFGEIGLFDDRHRAFLEAVAHLRPQLHRYCTRMTGSVMDGEDVMQEATFEAYRKLDLYESTRPLGPWLFGIAHNRCIDLLRRRRLRDAAEAELQVLEEEFVRPVEPLGHALDGAFERLVIHLPPKERACVLLKDIFDYSLEDIADLVDSTVGGVKAALSRGRGKLKALQGPPQQRQAPTDPEALALLRLYVDRFNRRDWDGVRDLTSADARLVVGDCFAGRLVDSPYFVQYGLPVVPWTLVPGEVDGEMALVILRSDRPEPTPFSAIRVQLEGDRIVSITDYIKCPWVLESSNSVVFASAA